MLKIKDKESAKELFNCGYSYCYICEHKQTDGCWGDEDWFCGFHNEIYAPNIDDLEECPRGVNMPLNWQMDEDALLETKLVEKVVSK